MKRMALMLVAALAGFATSATAEEPDRAPKTGYVIGVEDVLHISVWDESRIDLSVPVRPDGRISIPLADEIEVAGKSPEEVRAEIQARLSKYLEDPAVTVIVEEINSFRVSVLGEVNHQGVFTFRRPTRLLQALAAAGGFTRYAKKKVVLARAAYGVQQMMSIDLKPLLEGKDPKLNVFLKPEDTLLVR